MSTELTITIQDEEGKKLSRPYLIYETITLYADDPRQDPIISKCLNEMLEEFNGEPDDIKIRINKVLK